MTHWILLALHIEWCKSHAQTYRWTEEVWLLTEEMQHVLAFFVWKAKAWRAHASVREGTIADDLQEGLSAYVAHQAAIYDALQLACKVEWINMQEQVQEGERQIS
ncbi:hypothetical protein JVU11DRAFT_6251 [Chiua virens]|nr:hypothetical protein JVU11DRAFT_6251 [Chiua virens]